MNYKVGIKLNAHKRRSPSNWRNIKIRSLKILTSGCLLSSECTVDGKPYGDFPLVLKILNHMKVESVSFCPEYFSFGTPRSTPDIHGGNGIDVLDGKAIVLDENGIDLTDGILKASERMIQIANNNCVDLAILMDMSAACGSQVISDGNRFSDNRKYQKGPGVSAALLIRNGFPVVSQRDFKALNFIFGMLDATCQVDPQALDHHETKLYVSYFS